MGLLLSTARTFAPWFVVLTVAVLAIAWVVVGVSAVDGVGSWRWTAVRPA